MRLLVMVILIAFIVGCSGNTVDNYVPEKNYDIPKIDNRLTVCKNDLNDCNEVKNRDMDMYYDSWKDCKDRLDSCSLLRETPWSGCEGKPIIYTIEGTIGSSMLPFIDGSKTLGFCKVDRLRIGDIVLIPNSTSLCDWWSTINKPPKVVQFIPLVYLTSGY